MDTLLVAITTSNSVLIDWKLRGKFAPPMSWLRGLLHIHEGTTHQSLLTFTMKNPQFY